MLVIDFDDIVVDRKEGSICAETEAAKCVFLLIEVVADLYILTVSTVSFETGLVMFVVDFVDIVVDRKEDNICVKADGTFVRQFLENLTISVFKDS